MTISNLRHIQIIFQASFARQGVLNKDPIVWLDGARPPSRSMFLSMKNSHPNFAVIVRTREFAKFFDIKCI
jgi:hypothetical protein